MKKYISIALSIFGLQMTASQKEGRTVSLDYHAPSDVSNTFSMK